MTATEFNRHTIPNGGWQFRQPQTSWVAPTPIASTFDQTVQLIIKHRKQNLAITAKHKLATNPEAVATELELYTRKRLGLPETPQVPFRVPPSQFQSGEAAVAADDWTATPRQLATGAGTLSDWMEDGPVEHELAEKRAACCVSRADGKPCPKHKKGDWKSFFTAPVVKLIQKQVEQKTGMKLFTSLDKELGVCDACGCPMEAKVHVKKSTIMVRIKEPELGKLDPGCWILNEA